MDQNKYIDGIRSGDKVILRELYQINLPKFISWIKLNSGTIEDAHDIFQDGMEAMMHLCFDEDFVIKSSLNSLIMTICKNKWIDKLRKKKTEQKVRLELASRQKVNTNMEFNFDQLHNQTAVQNMLTSTFQQISPLCQQLLKLIENGARADEVAHKLEMSNANTVYRRKFACLQSWRKHIEAHDYYNTWKKSKL